MQGQVTKIDVPNEALRFLLIQRAEYRSPIYSLFSNRLMKRLIGGKFRRQLYQRFGLPLERWFKSDAEKKYSEDMARIFESFRQYLPETVNHVLDIGSGVGGINILTYQAFESRPEIWLLDKSGMSDVWNKGYHENTSTFSYYNSFEYAVALLSLNGVPSSKVHCCDFDIDGFPYGKKFDLIYSFLSWGFHYPISVYLEDVSKSLSSRGILVVDIRKGTDGKAALVEHFGMPATVVLDGNKFERVVIARQN